MKFKNVIVTKRGGPEVLQIIEKDLHSPKNGEVLIKIQAAGVGRTDILMRYLNYPGAPRIPFVPGYEIVGIIQEISPGVKTVKVGDRVGALTVIGGYAEFIYLKEEHLVKVPASLDSAEAVSIILNYTSAYQMFKHVAGVKEGNHVFITGASGGVGSAFLDLGKMEKLVLYGTASYSKHEQLKQYGALLIDYRQNDFVEMIGKTRPEGMDFVFDGLGGAYIKKSIKIIHPGGKLVEYGFSLKSFTYFMKTMFDMFSGLPKGVKAKAYGISVNYKMNKKPVLEDMAVLFNLLEEGKIKPLIYKRLPLLEAADANRLLESGEVTGKIVLIP
jgi:NADPH:quinone reductase-like Zn-dependent oxidoreductase